MSLGVQTPTGLLFGNQITWGNVQPEQLRWALPPVGLASGTTVGDFSLRER